jgi:hypothetical protein
MPTHQKTRTLLELRTELAVRLGFVSVGQASVMHQPLLISFLQEAAEQIHAQYGDDLLYLVNNTFPTVQGERFYAFPDDADPYKIDSTVIEDAGSFRPVIRGIPAHLRTSGDDDPSKQGIPSRWDIAAGEDHAADPGRIELWQVPDSTYTMHMSYYPIYAYAEGGWNDDVLPCPIYPSRLCLILATANAKSHFGMQDAAAYYQQFDELLNKHRASLLYGVRFKIGTEFGSHRDDGIGSRHIEPGIHADMTPPESILSETGDAILPEQST